MFNDGKEKSEMHFFISDFSLFFSDF